MSLIFTIYRRFKRTCPIIFSQNRFIFTKQMNHCDCFEKLTANQEQ